MVHGKKYRESLKGTSQVLRICNGKIQNCVSLPAVTKQNATFSPDFTQPGKSLIEIPCMCADGFSILAPRTVSDRAEAEAVEAACQCSASQLLFRPHRPHASGKEEERERRPPLQPSLSFA